MVLLVPEPADDGNESISVPLVEDRASTVHIEDSPATLVGLVPTLPVGVADAVEE
jgi:hypothetical protein